MLPGFKSFRIYRGDTFVFQLTLKSAGQAYSLSGCTFAGQIKEKGKTTTVASFSISIVNQSQGIVRVTLTAAESAKLSAGKSYDYDIQMTNSGVVSTILKGPILVTFDVTN